MPLQQTSGAASYDAFGGGVPVEPNYIESVFSCFLYTGNGSTQTINNGIDLAGKGGLVWGKNRSAGWDHYLADTAQGVGKFLSSNLTSATQLDSTSVTAFNSNGFSIGNAGSSFNDSGQTYASWTFRKQPKFFDVVTWTGNGTGNGRRLAHNLGSVPGCMIFKRTNTTGNWGVWHRTFSNPTDDYLTLNTTNAIASFTNNWGTSAPTDTDFPAGYANGSGDTYVAYLFAHNAGGFGLSGTDNVISCGSFTASGTGGDVTLGYEPQWVMIKRTDSTGSWRMLDIMRGYDNGDTDASLFANTSAAETFSQVGTPFANGFTEFLAAGTYIYIAIRRGPMAVPTTGTSVFTATATTASVDTQITTGFPVDTNIVRDRTASSGFQSGFAWVDRLRRMSSDAVNSTFSLQSTNTNAEDTVYGMLSNANNTGFAVSGDYGGTSQIYYSLRRAPGFFDEVCYTSGVSDPTTLTLNHNLGAVPQMMIKKARQTNGVSNSWRVYHIGLNGGSNPQNAVIRLDDSGAETVSTPDWGNTSPTATQLTVGYVESGISYVTYLFASCPGVSKVGSYTGTGTTQVINCGFAAGSRFVLIKRTDSTGDWYVWDSARGIVAGNDPYLLLNSTAAEVTNTDFIDTAATGFEISSTAPAAINASGGTFIFLAIA